MTAVSISQAPQAPPPQSLQTKTAERPDASQRSDASQESATDQSSFGSQLRDAIQERKGQSKNATNDSKAGDGDAKETGKKKDGQSQIPVLAAILAAVLPAVPLGSFGLPAEGTDAGKSADSAAPAQETQTAALPVDTSTPAPVAAEAPAPAQPETAANLAFALKLDTTNFKAVAKDGATPPQAVAASPTGAAAAAAIPATAPHADLKVVATPLPAAITINPPAPSVPTHSSDAPPPDAKSHISAQPVKAASSSTAHTQQSDTPESDTGSPDKEPAKDQPKIERASAPSPEKQPVEVKSAREAGAPPAHVENTITPSSPSVTTTVQSVEPRTPAPASSVAAPSITEHVAASPADVRTTTPSTEVTDVSVTIPIPRADSAGDDRVAIRMVQRGTEIHVSVRTPDHQLTQSLRQDLGKLSTSLDQAGFRTESWRPAATNMAAQSQSNGRHESRQGAPNQDGPGSDARSGGQNGRGARDQRRRQQDEAPRWVAELEQYKNQ